MPTTAFEPYVSSFRSARKVDWNIVRFVPAMHSRILLPQAKIVWHFSQRPLFSSQGWCNISISQQPLLTGSSVTTSTITATRTAAQVSITNTISASATSTATGLASLTTTSTQIVSTTTTFTDLYTVTLTDMPTFTATDKIFVYVTTTTTTACANQKRVLEKNSGDNITRWTKPGLNLTFVDTKLAVRAAPPFAPPQ